ncbi:MAG: hypothetical protein Q8S04_09670, partial [Bacteroidales bacterium]|nr:hypothetical protein [Bacteroidales bacterium]
MTKNTNSLLTIIFGLFIITSCTNNQAIKNKKSIDHWELNNLKGLVQSSNETIYSFVENSDDLQKEESRFVLFNENGKLIEEITFNAVDNLESKFKYTYNDRGERIEEIEYNS